MKKLTEEEKAQLHAKIQQEQKRQEQAVRTTIRQNQAEDKGMEKRVSGVLLGVMAVIIGGWVASNIVFDRTPPPRIHYFKSTTNDIMPQINEGESVTLSWKTSNADEVKIEAWKTSTTDEVKIWEDKQAGLSGHKSVSPKFNTTYTLIATNRNGLTVKSTAGFFMVRVSKAPTGQ